MPEKEDPYDLWFDKYKPIINKVITDGEAPYDGRMFETYGKELATVQLAVKNKPRHVWTLVTGDNGEDFIVCAGFHYVNRMGYFITAEPWQDSSECYVAWLGEEEDDDDIEEDLE